MPTATFCGREVLDDASVDRLYLYVTSSVSHEREWRVNHDRQRSERIFEQELLWHCPPWQPLAHQRGSTHGRRAPT